MIVMVRSALLATAAVALATTMAASAQETVPEAAISPASTLSVYAFPATGKIGGAIQEAPTLHGATLVGSTVLGGSCQRDPSGCGVVYRATPPADGQTVWTAKALKSFDGQSEGRQPASKLVVGPDGALYGATSAGGAGGAGTVWRLK